MKIINGLKLYEAKELAKMFDVSLITIAKLRRNGLRSVKLGHKVYTSEETIRDYLNGLIDVKKKAQGVTIEQEDDQTNGEAEITLEQARQELINKQMQITNWDGKKETYTIAGIHLLRDTQRFPCGALNVISSYSGRAKYWSKDAQALYAIASNALKNVYLFYKNEVIDLFNGKEVEITLNDQTTTYVIKEGKK